MNLTFNSFFAGIGGFDLALERAGLKCNFQCEINSFCNEILQKHWPEVKRADDIRSLNAQDIPAADIWCAGFPCQDVSVARGSNGREGLKGKNSGLFFEFIDLVKVKKPSVILLENVVGLLNSHNGQDFRIILEVLADLGYSTAWRVMNSRYFGAPQSRPRVFICAVLGNSALPIEILFENEPGSRPKNQRSGFLTANECKQSGAFVPEVAYCLAATSGRHTGTDWSRTYVSYQSSVRRLTPRECEGLQGFPKNWTLIESQKCGTKDIDSPRYQALGNAVCVPVVEWIAKRAARVLANESLTSETREKSLFTDFTSFSDFRHKTVRHQLLSKLHLPVQGGIEQLKWMSGGYVCVDDCWDLKAPEAPSTIITKPLVKVLEKKRPAKKYFLSPNAAEGILRRVLSQNRTLFKPMHNALERLRLSNQAA